jgi:hypothetical protein
MFVDDLLRANKIGTPIVLVQTQDAIETAAQIVAAVGEESPVFEWDCIRGISPANKPAEAVPFNGDASDITSMLMGARATAPEGAIILCHGLNRWLDHPMTVQALLNLRDSFKGDHRMIVGLGTDFQPWAELTHSVMTLDDPLPDAHRLAGVVSETAGAAEVVLGQEKIDLAAERLAGLTEFAAEQSVAMSLVRKNGHATLDQDRLWQRKQKQIEQTPGLKVWHGLEKFDAIGGCDNIKQFLTRFGQGPHRPNAIVFVDEIEKALAGAGAGGGDTSGVSQDQLGVLLTEMQDQNYDGCIFVGPPGAAKSAVAKAAGNEFGVPTVQLDLGGLKGSLVGQSEQQARAALKVIRAISSGRALWIATCNAIATLKPELRRRFTMGVYFFDLPDGLERERIWIIYRAQFLIEDSRLPDDEGWTGAEIRTCCRLSHMLGLSLIDAAKYIVPVAKQAPDVIEGLRNQAVGRFLSASREGVYQRPEPPAAKKTKRSIAIHESKAS